MASIKRVNASKHMQYEAVLQNLGKKMFYKAPPANASLFAAILYTYYKYNCFLQYLLFGDDAATIRHENKNTLSIY